MKRNQHPWPMTLEDIKKLNDIMVNPFKKLFEEQITKDVREFIKEKTGEDSDIEFKFERLKVLKDGTVREEKKAAK